MVVICVKVIVFLQRNYQIFNNKSLQMKQDDRRKPGASRKDSKNSHSRNDVHIGKKVETSLLSV